jgi:hypothetical protein
LDFLLLFFSFFGEESPSLLRPLIRLNTSVLSDEEAALLLGITMAAPKIALFSASVFVERSLASECFLYLQKKQ